MPMSSPEQTAALTSTSLAASYALATQTLRTTVRWLLTSAAGVGGVLVAGMQLTSIGALGLAEWPRLLAALLGLAVTLWAIGNLINRASHVLSDDWLTLAQISGAEFRAILNGSDRAGLFASLKLHQDELYTHVAKDLPALYKRLRELNELDCREPGTNLDLTHDAATVRDAVIAVVQFANYYSTRIKFDALRATLLRAGFIATVGVVVFAYAANPPA
jgi:hypothetical protein